MNKMLDELKDIKPPVEVPDHSFLLLLLILALLLLLLAALFFWIHRRKKSRRKRGKDPVKDAKRRLKEIEFLDAKDAVYKFDEYFPVAANGDEELLREFEALWQRLERYKYKKEVPPLKIEDEASMKRLIERVQK